MVVSSIRVASISFLIPISIWGLDVPSNIFAGNFLHWTCILSLVLHSTLGFFSTNYMGVIWRSYLIGAIMAIGLALSSTSWQGFGWYMCVVAFFHISEYLVTAYYNPMSLSYDTFLLNHSTAYSLAHLACCTEYAVTLYFLPAWKSFFYVQIFGLILCIAGELIRKGAMRTAGVAFTHQIQYDKRDSHELITHGLYSYCRHPSYAGWFLWSVSTQLILCNPISFVGFLMASWQFFYTRIQHEEMVLLNLFEDDYVKYQIAVRRTGVPFVPGYLLET